MSSSVFTSNISIWLQMASRKSFCKHLPAATGGGVWLPCATIGSPLLRFPTSLHEGIVRYVACMCPFIVDVQNLPFGSGTSMQLRITAYRFAVWNTKRVQHQVQLHSHCRVNLTLGIHSYLLRFWCFLVPVLRGGGPNIGAWMSTVSKLLYFSTLGASLK